MSVNRHNPHLYVLPEDDANRQIANGFLNNLNLDDSAIKVLPVLRGWKHVVDEFTNVHAAEMRRFEERRIVLLIDFDQQQATRLSMVKSRIPPELMDRVFVLGVLSNPEDLRNRINKSFEKIGEALSQDCVDNTRTVWGHDLLRHNEAELDRMISSVRPFLFSALFFE